jgi:hypothetical protein
VVNKQAMRCSKCRTENPVGKKFCGECGSGFTMRCPKCGADNAPPFKFCGDCGAALTTAGPATGVRDQPEAPAIRVTSERPLENLEGERKTVTALFADIKGSMELREDWRLRLNWKNRTLAKLKSFESALKTPRQGGSQ